MGPEHRAVGSGGSFNAFASLLERSVRQYEQVVQQVKTYINRPAVALCCSVTVTQSPDGRLLMFQGKRGTNST